jgi:hypothetical protein
MTFAMVWALELGAHFGACFSPHFTVKGLGLHVSKGSVTRGQSTRDVSSTILWMVSRFKVLRQLFTHATFSPQTPSSLHSLRQG